MVKKFNLAFVNKSPISLNKNAKRILLTNDNKW